MWNVKLYYTIPYLTSHCYNNNNKLTFQNAQLTENCHKGACVNQTKTVQNRAFFQKLSQIIER